MSFESYQMSSKNKKDINFKNKELDVDILDDARIRLREWELPEVRWVRCNALGSR